MSRVGELAATQTTKHMPTQRSREPADLGRLSGIDPLTLEPGMIIWDRFCVVGKVRHASPVWAVPITDLERELGRPPHHRISLQYLPIPERHRERVRRAVTADEAVQPRVRATIDLPGGMALVHEPVEGEHLGAQLPARESRALAVALTGLVNRLHEAKVRGISLRVGELRQSEGRFRLEGFSHLCGAGTAEQDVEDLVALLRRVAGRHVATLLEPPPRSAAELWGRARALTRDEGPPTSPLSPHPPFVGREQGRRALEQAFSDAQIARSSVTLVCGAQGVGKSRLLEEFASWLRAEERAVLLTGEYLSGCGESRAGLMGALGRLPVALSSCPPEAAERVCDRLTRRTGSLAGVLASYAPGLADLLDVGDEASSPPPEVHSGEFEEGFARHAVAVAEGVRAIGSQDRPLVILLDNLELADRGSVAVLRRLLVEDRSHHTMIVAGLCGQAPPGLADAPDDSNWNPKRDPQLLLRRVVLESLAVAELERMIVAGLPGPVVRANELAEVLHEASRGNPLVAWATLQSWIERGVLVREDPEPWSLRKRKVGGTSPKRVFTDRVEAASLDERWLALLAAVAGGHVDEAWFQRVSGWDPKRVGGAISGLERRGLMTKAGEASLRFPHELVRELVVKRTPAGDVRRAHATVAGWLASLGPRVSAARLAYHTDRALGQDSHSDPHLAQMHLAAGREMLGVFDLERSGWHFTRALVERGRGAGRFAAVEGAADVALLGRKYDEAAQLYAEAVVEADDPLVASRIAAKAVHGLFRKSVARGAATIGRLALARADRPLPEAGLRLRASIFEAKLRLGLTRDKPGEPVEGRGDPVVDKLGQDLGDRAATQLREQLCWLYARMAVVLALPEPRSAQLCLLRALRHARGLESAAASSVLALHGAHVAMHGKVDEGKQLLRQATELATRVSSDWALAMAQHLRGHLVELPAGEYRQGLASLDEAVAHFRRTGDLSIAVASLFFKAAYARDREPLQVLHGWLDEAAALNEVQGDTVVDLGIDALRLYLRARVGARNVVDAAASLSARASARELVNYEGYLPHAYLALALLEVGEQTRAREQVELGLTRAFDRPHMPDFAYDLWAALALVLVRGRAPSDERLREDTLRRLDKAGRQSPRLAAFAQLARMRHAMATGKRDRARVAAGALISGLASHGQVQFALEAHRALGELLRGSDVLAAREHVHLASELAAELGLDDARERERELDRAAEQQDVPLARAHDRTSRRHSNAYLRALARNELVEVAEVLEGSRQVLLETVGSVPWLYLRARPQLRVHGELLELQSLLVHLAMCARDSVVEPEQLRAVGTLEELDAVQASEIPGASPGSWGRIAVTVLGRPTTVGVTGGVSACRQVATRLGGFLDVEQDDEQLMLAVYLPAERTRASSSAHPGVGVGVGARARAGPLG
ncbi:ATP-binding protein, partial [Enhygromyxa salina]|uniref:ATP-binding protein n=1 Tax=Enhygromyxa salina TaxID=215803 RepID=UPI0011B25F46